MKIWKETWSNFRTIAEIFNTVKLAQSCPTIWMRNKGLCTEVIIAISGFSIITIWPGSQHSPIRIIAQEQWFMYQNQFSFEFL